MKRTTLIWTVIIITVAIIGIGGFLVLSNSQQDNPATTPTKGTVVIKDSVFKPDTITINQGETVTWRNDDSFIHRIAAEDSSFVLSDMPAGGLSKYKFEKTGTFKYYCQLHTFMKGTVVVK